MQGTGALRPDGSTSAQFIRAIKAKYPEQLVMADCDNLENAMLCAEAGADFVGTTMRGYCWQQPMRTLPRWGSRCPTGGAGC